MINYPDLLSKISLLVYDEHICNFLLISPFEVKNSKLVLIYKILAKQSSDLKAYELIICALHSIHIPLHQFGICSNIYYEKHKGNLIHERSLCVKVYCDCTDENLIKFVKLVFNKSVKSINCQEFFEIVSNTSILFHSNIFKNEIKKFYDENQLDRFEMDGKRKRPRLSNSDDLLINAVGHAGDIRASMKHLSFNDSYEIKDLRENFCLVYNNENRKGSDLDVVKIKKTFENIEGFKVECITMKSKECFIKSLKHYISSNSINSDMIICFFMSHGGHNYIFDDSDKKIREDEIRNLFSSLLAPTLINKPKILIFQSCRGEKINEVHIQSDNFTPQEEEISRVECTAPESSRDVCIEFSDFFFIHSTLTGHYSCRDVNEGSWFIQTFCSLVQQYSKQNDLDEICTMVNKHWQEFRKDGKTFTQICEVRKALLKNKIFLEKPFN